MTKKESIVNAALKLVTQKGIHATPMSEIAKAAGTGMGTIYNYFATKEILINAIYVDIKQREEQLFNQASEEDSIAGQFHQHYANATRFYLENPDCFLFMDQLLSSPMITEESKEVGQKSIQVVLELIGKGQEEGLIKDIPVNELMQFIGGAILSHVRFLLNNSLQSRPLENQLRLVWDAIRT